MRVLAAEIMRGCAFYFFTIVTDSAALTEHMPCACRLCQDVDLMRIIRNALATDGATDSASGAHVFTPFVYTLLPHRITPVIAHVCASAGRGCACGRLDAVLV